MSLLDDVSIVVTPNGYKAGTLYGVIPSNGDGDMDVTRATDATRVDEDGLIEDVLSNVPRIDYTGGGCPHILVEPLRTNIVFPSDVAVTQTRTVTAVEYALSFYGTGSIVLSGTHSATLTGTGVNDRVDLIFTPTAGSLVLTVSGTVTNFQLEVGSYATSLIPTVSGTVTRNQDKFTRDGIGSLIGQTEGTFFIELSKPTTIMPTLGLITLNNAASNSDRNSVAIGFFGSDDFFLRVQSENVSVFSSSNIVTSANTFYKVAISYKSGESLIYVDGSPVTPNQGSLAGTFTFGVTLDNLSFDYNGNNVLPFYGKVKQLQVYDTALTDDQLTDLTS